MDDFDPIFWFVCRFCKQTFPDTDKLIKHKLDNHLENVPKIKCVIFEERFLDHEWSPSDNFDFPPKKDYDVNVVHKDTQTDKVRITYPGQLNSSYSDGSLLNVSTQTDVTSQELVSFYLNRKNSYRQNNRNFANRKRALAMEGEGPASVKAELLSSLKLRIKTHRPNDPGDPNFIKSEPMSNSEDSQPPASPTPGSGGPNSPSNSNETSSQGRPDNDVNSEETSREFIPTASTSAAEYAYLMQQQQQKIPTIWDDVDFQGGDGDSGQNDNSGGDDVDSDAEGQVSDPTSFLQQSLHVSEQQQLQLQQMHQQQQQQQQYGYTVTRGRPRGRPPGSGRGRGRPRGRPPGRGHLHQQGRQQPLFQVEFQPIRHSERQTSNSRRQQPNLEFKSYMEDRPFKCPHCPVALKSKMSLQRHLVVHGTSTRFRCQFCGKSCISNHALLDHERTHTGDRPFKCEVSNCTDVFTSKTALNMHTRRKHSEELGLERYACTTCGKIFGLKSELNKHIQVHPTEEINKGLTCGHEGCSMEFKTKFQVAEHMEECMWRY